MRNTCRALEKLALEDKSFTKWLPPEEAVSTLTAAAQLRLSRRFVIEVLRGVAAAPARAGSVTSVLAAAALGGWGGIGEFAAPLVQIAREELRSPENPFTALAELPSGLPAQNNVEGSNVHDFLKEKSASEVPRGEHKDDATAREVSWEAGLRLEWVALTLGCYPEGVELERLLGETERVIEERLEWWEEGDGEGVDEILEISFELESMLKGAAGRARGWDAVGDSTGEGHVGSVGPSGEIQGSDKVAEEVECGGAMLEAHGDGAQEGYVAVEGADAQSSIVELAVSNQD